VLVEFSDGMYLVPEHDVRQQERTDEYEFEALWEEGHYYGCAIMFKGTHVHYSLARPPLRV